MACMTTAMREEGGTWERSLKMRESVGRPRVEVDDFDFLVSIIR